MKAGRSQLWLVGVQVSRVLHVMLRVRTHSATLPSMHFVNRDVRGMQMPARTNSPASAAGAIAAGKSIAAAKIRNLRFM
ncbi:MAG: hypothetical protein ACLPPF_03175 [Rhodomicrobium sp.]